VISSDKKFVFTGSKDGSIIKWNAETRLKEKTIKKRIFAKNPKDVGHTDEVLCMAITSDFKYLVD